MFGKAIEDILGTSGFLRIYFLSGIIGGICQVIGGILLPNQIGTGAVVGASAGLYGLIAAFATISPHERITMFLYFIPITITARTLLLVSLGLSIFFIFVPTGNVANAAHLGGMLTGILIMRLFPSIGARLEFPTFSNPFKKKKWHSTFAGKGTLAPARKDFDMPPAEFISREVDPILDKISAHGIQSLTERERKILEAARARMAKR